MTRSKWDQRIQRAAGLAETYPFAAEVLRLYKSCATFQRSLYERLEADVGQQLSDLTSPPSAPGFDLLLPALPDFFSTIARIAPEPVEIAARKLASQDSAHWRDLLGSCWSAAPDFQPAPTNIEAALAWVFLQPYAELLAARRKPTQHSETLAVCPFCSARPVVGVLRPEGEGGKRSLICSFCATEWTFGRIRCAACGEEAVEKLAVYAAEQFEHIRVEACDGCRHFIKTVDLTRNGRAVPQVDELAALPLDLWALEHGYIKLQPNFLGI